MLPAFSGGRFADSQIVHADRAMFADETVGFGEATPGVVDGQDCARLIKNGDGAGQSVESRSPRGRLLMFLSLGLVKLAVGSNSGSLDEQGKRRGSTQGE